MTLARHWRLLILLTALLIAAGFLAPRVVRAPELEENRVLASWPAPPKGLADLVVYRRGLDVYVADRFPARPHLIAAANMLRLGLGGSGSPRVAVGRDGWLFYDDGGHLGAAQGRPALTRLQAQAWLEGLAGRTQALQARGIAYLVVAAPLKETLYPQYAPSWFPGPSEHRPARDLTAWAGASGAGRAIYLHEALERPARWGLKTYGRNDTHWTGIGAHLAYGAIMRELNSRGLAEPPRALETFEEVRSATPPRDLALMIGVADLSSDDFPEFEDSGLRDQLRITYLTRATDEAAARLVETGQTGKPVLLITGDSFARALTPFFYSHFSRVIFAHNREGTWREDLIDRFHPDVVILEVLESGLAASLSPAPPASPEARARIAQALRSPPPPPIAASGAPRVSRRIEGGPRGERLSGGPGDDLIYGRAGDDEIAAGPGRDHVQGGQGADRIDGGPGDDWLSGDRGADRLTGGPGADIFRLGADGGADVAADFDATAGDRIELDPGATWRLEQAGADTVLVVTGPTAAGARLTLRGAPAAKLPKEAVFSR